MMACVMSTNPPRFSTRRDFLRNTAITTAALASTAAHPVFAAAQQVTAQSTSKPSPIQLGMASYTFREFDRARVIDFMKELKLANLNAVGTVYFPKDEDEDIRSKFDYAKRAGVKVIVAGDPAPTTLPRIEKFVKEYDIRFAIHNHGPEDKVWPSPLDVLKAVGNMDPRMGCCIDVGHCERAGTDVVTAIKQVGPRLFDVHMKDLTDFHSKESQVAVGDGIMPVHGIFEALIAINYQGYVDLEYEIHGDDPMPGVIKSFAYMRGVLAGMGYQA